MRIGVYDKEYCTWKKKKMDKDNLCKVVTSPGLRPAQEAMTHDGDSPFQFTKLLTTYLTQTPLPLHVSLYLSFLLTLSVHYFLPYRWLFPCFFVTLPEIACHVEYLTLKNVPVWLTSSDSRVLYTWPINLASSPTTTSSPSRLYTWPPGITL